MTILAEVITVLFSGAGVTTTGGTAIAGAVGNADWSGVGADVVLIDFVVDEFPDVAAAGMLR